MKLNNKECETLLKRIENADNEKVLHLVLNRTLSYINLRELYIIIENLKTGNCEIGESEHYLIDNDLNPQYFKSFLLPLIAYSVP